MSDELDNNEEVRDPKALLEAYRKLQADVVELRNENKELQSAADAGSPDEVRKWKSMAIRAEARNNVNEMGIKDADRILKRVSLENVDFDEDGNLTGFNESLDEFKKDFPELFDKKLRAGGLADAHAAGTVEKQKTPSQLQAEALLK